MSELVDTCHPRSIYYEVLQTVYQYWFSKKKWEQAYYKEFQFSSIHANKQLTRPIQKKIVLNFDTLHSFSG